MNPSWLTVEKASTFFISFCTRATEAASSAVSAPTMATTAMAVGEARNRALNRTHK